MPLENRNTVQDAIATGENAWKTFMKNMKTTKEPLLKSKYLISFYFYFFLIRRDYNTD